MAHTIKTLYVVHHSHTDIGYTDLQERVIDNQTDYLRSALQIMKQPENKDFRWNCETYFCVEEFLKEATSQEKEEFFTLISEDRMGLSATYLNFNDLVDAPIYKKRVAEMVAIFKAANITPTTAMTADINGISMGQRNAMLDNGIEFLFTNVHCHHGMYPLYQNQNAYWWEDALGRRLLVWNGEHYNLGNALGIKPNRTANFMTQDRFGEIAVQQTPDETLWNNVDQYLSLCEENKYPHDFIISSVSGVFSDNAPPEPEILRMIESFNETHGSEVRLQMVSLQELYALIRDKVADAPVLRGDLNDWWAGGVGSTPYAVKHYKEAQRRYHLCHRLDANISEKFPELARTAEDNMLLYAEHTWGHSSTIICPYDTMVLNLDMRKNSYASKFHESVSRMLNRIVMEKGDILRYYNTSGKIKVCNPNKSALRQPIEFYIESPHLKNAKITTDDGRVLPCQVSPHPRGRKITFTDSFAPKEEKNYSFEELPATPQLVNSRKAYVGSDRIRDIVNDYDPTTYLLPYEYENQWFKISYQKGKGVTSFINKKTGKDMLAAGSTPFFTPMYECTEVKVDCSEFPCPEEQERRIMGRNIRGKHAQLHTGVLTEVVCREQGDVFTLLELKYTLPGTVHANVFIKLFNELPKIDFKLELGKTISSNIESVFMPMTLELEKKSVYLKKGDEAFRPGIDQIPGTCMEYYMSDDGMAYTYNDGSVLIASKDVPLFYTGEMQHHPIRLCDGNPENNQRPIYSWVMNNTWETNFKMDLSGFCEYMYSLWLSDETEPEKAMEALGELVYEPHVLITE